MVRLFGFSRYEERAFRKGLVIIQIDALSRTQLEKAVKAGEVPFLENLLQEQHYRLHSHYTGTPCNTASVQAELFYGVKAALPAFSFYNCKSSRVFTMFNPKDALEIEHRL